MGGRAVARRPRQYDAEQAKRQRAGIRRLNEAFGRSEAQRSKAQQIALKTRLLDLLGVGARPKR